MNKWTAGLLAVVLMLGITACGKEKEADGNAANGGNANQGNKVEATTDSNATPTLEELLTKSAEASKTMKSFSMEASIDQDITVTQGEEKQEQNVKMTITSDMITDPLQIFQEIKMNVAGQGETEMKQYISKEGVYSNVDGTWSKQPDDSVEKLLASMEDSANPDKQLSQFKKISKDTKITVEGDEYVLTADVSGDSVKELAKELMSQSGGSNEQTVAMMEQMNIKNIKMTSVVNKKSFLPTRADINMTMEMEQDGAGISLEMAMKTSFSKYNEINEIKVPQEALDSAK
ncbi:hypothetical protein J2T12_005436 [Paenibacillus anaericanus]|uniref:DUF6612 family protein n=1 Tax=Paenibacillus anaericanus TaxID=170367 RepID=UPI0027899C23|nr:DUF6612 family protein [Paenibacillus anaericanus]MDQ0091992.1 hypothetical protein [Paenibacillus anaericanus]